MNINILLSRIIIGIIITAVTSRYDHFPDSVQSICTNRGLYLWGKNRSACFDCAIKYAVIFRQMLSHSGPMHVMSKLLWAKTQNQTQNLLRWWVSGAITLKSKSLQLVFSDGWMYPKPDVSDDYSLLL